jgi:Spy/CpxP family protein refolding chaperone
MPFAIARRADSKPEVRSSGHCEDVRSRMMKEDLDLAAKYRQRAKQLRDRARSEALNVREVLLKIADDYDRLARSRELIDTLDRRRK